MNQNLSIPIAIVIAGLCVAGSIFYINKDKLNSVNPNSGSGDSTKFTIDILPISPSDHIFGNPNADIKIVEYSDTECPYCKVFHVSMHETISSYGKDGQVAWVYRHFPIPSLHPKAPKEAEATECVAREKGETAFWSYLDSIYSTTESNNKLPEESLYSLANKVGMDNDALKNCLDNGDFTEKITNSYDEAQKAGARGTPYSVIMLKNELSTEKITALNSLNDKATGGDTSYRILTIDEKTKDKVAMSGALPTVLINSILDIITAK